MKDRPLRRSLVAAIVVAAVAVAGCASALPPEAFDAGSPRMRPEIFFLGTTRSSGVIEARDGAPTGRLHVEGRGVALPDGTFRLDQVVTIARDAPRARTWLLGRIDEHRYVGTLDDASGPVECEAYGDLFHIRYPMKSPVGGRMEQWLYLQPDGRTVLNEATVRVFGVVVARLSERITHEDSP